MELFSIRIQRTFQLVSTEKSTIIIALLHQWCSYGGNAKRY